jgi:hypothetical protein
MTDWLAQLLILVNMTHVSKQLVLHDLVHCVIARHTVPDKEIVRISQLWNALLNIYIILILKHKCLYLLASAGIEMASMMESKVTPSALRLFFDAGSRSEP